jgi:hypothetical protein
MKARIAETSERNKLKVKIGWLTPMSKEDLMKCNFFKKSKNQVDKLP